MRLYYYASSIVTWESNDIVDNFRHSIIQNDNPLPVVAASLNAFSCLHFFIVARQNNSTGWKVRHSPQITGIGGDTIFIDSRRCRTFRFISIL